LVSARETHHCDLKKNHDTAKGLFEQFENAKTPCEEEIIEQALTELKIHAVLEKKITGGSIGHGTSGSGTGARRAARPTSRGRFDAWKGERSSSGTFGKEPHGGPESRRKRDAAREYAVTHRQPLAMAGYC
jgi:hypothetical protein